VVAQPKGFPGCTLFNPVHLCPHMRMAAKIKTPKSPTIDAVKSQVHTTDVFRFITLSRTGLAVFN